MVDHKNEEIDFFYLFLKLKEVLKRGNVLFFKGVNFTVRNWIIIAALIAIGAGYGYYSNKDENRNKKATVLLRVNFETVNYVYNSLYLLEEKVEQQDEVFLSKIGFNAEVPEISSIQILPVINLKEIVEQFEASDRNFEAILKNVEFNDIDDEETPISQTFVTNYKHHVVEFDFTNQADENTLVKIIDYLNDNELLQELKNVTITNVEGQIVNNKETIKQINIVLESYVSNESLPSSSSQIYVVDKNFNITTVLEKKIELQRENESLNKFLVYSDDIVVMVNAPNITYVTNGVLDEKEIIYPIFLVFSFLFLAYLRHIFITLKNIASKTELNE